MKVFQYRARGKEENLRRLAALDPSPVASWVGWIDVANWSFWFVKAQMCVDFCYLDKGSSHYWSNFVRNKRLNVSTRFHTKTRCRIAFTMLVEWPRMRS